MRLLWNKSSQPGGLEDCLGKKCLAKQGEMPWGRSGLGSHEVQT